MYTPADNRYDRMQYRPCGHSGLCLPMLSLGLWHNFGEAHDLDHQTAMLRTAFDHGITHFDLANNYGPPPGTAERHFGQILRRDFKAYRDELIISTKAGWPMWAGPYGQGGGSRKHLISSIDQSLTRLNLDYVDIFYSHRFDPDTPLAETASALADIVTQGKALYIGISSYSAAKTKAMAALLRDQGVPLLIHQPSYNLLNRWVEGDLLQRLAQEGMGCIAFTPLAQGLLTDKYLKGIPESARVNQAGGGSLLPSHLSEDNLARVRGLNQIAQQRGQTLAQMALAWVLRQPQVSSALIGASSPQQIIENVGALARLDFDDATLDAINTYAVDSGINLWEKPSTDQRP